MPLRYTVIGSTILSLIIICSALYNVIQENQRYHEMYGPNPAYVKWEADTGANGVMAVRDYDNAKAEIEAYLNKTYADLAKLPADPNSKVKIEGTLPVAAKVTKIERVDKP